MKRTFLADSAGAEATWKSREMAVQLRGEQNEPQKKTWVQPEDQMDELSRLFASTARNSIIFTQINGQIIDCVQG